MVYLISEAERVARKNYKCMASEFIMEDEREHEFYTDDEIKIIEAARANNFMIKKGQKYTRQFMNDNGEVYDFKAITEMHKICLKYDLYED